MPRDATRQPVTDDDADDVGRGYDLAAQLEQIVHGERSAAVVLAGCWLLAAVIVQAIETEDHDDLEAISAVTQQLCVCVMHLKSARAVTKQ